jgi:hypothetical protein
MGAYEMKTVYFKQPLLIIKLPSKAWGSGDPWKKVMAKFVGLHGWMFDEIMHYLCSMARVNEL